MTLVPTPEQEAIIAAAVHETTSMMVSAYAGCAKSSTIEMATRAMAEGGRLPPATLALAFNVKIKKELERRLPDGVTVLTLNGLGHRAWGATIRKFLTIDDRKLGRLVTATAKANGHNHLPGDQWETIRELCSRAMQAGLVPSKYPHKGLVPDTPAQWAAIAQEAWLEAPPALVDLARATLCESISEGFAGTISFDDQIYLPCMFNGAFPRFALVLVDEAQDLSPLNHRQVAAVAGPQGRLLVVGDPKQAIYAFRGADSQSMARLRALRPAWIDLPLKLTFRCPKAIVTRQQAHAPGFTPHESNSPGQLVDWNLPTGKPIEWTWRAIETICEDHLKGPRTSVAVLCRNNAPLLSLAFKLLRQFVGVQMLGRDIGKGLVALAKKLLPQDSTPQEACRKAIEEWLTSECSLLRANDREDKIPPLVDRAECLLAVLDGGATTAGALRTALSDLFSRDAGQVTLSSIHRAKGLEWDLVVHLDPWRVPSKWAKGPQLAQELNLKYVCETRTRNVLVQANLEDFQ